MILTVLITVFILLVAGGVCYLITTYIANAMAKNVMLVGTVIVAILVLLRFFRLI